MTWEKVNPFLQGTKISSFYSNIFTEFFAVLITGNKYWVRQNYKCKTLRLFILLESTENESLFGCTESRNSMEQEESIAVKSSCCDNILSQPRSGVTYKDIEYWIGHWIYWALTPLTILDYNLQPSSIANTQLQSIALSLFLIQSIMLSQLQSVCSSLYMHWALLVCCPTSPWVLACNGGSWTVPFPQPQ
jgi:hypothetical protein